MDWHPIDTAPEGERVFIWMEIGPGIPLSFGWSDELEIPNAYKLHGRWYHDEDGNSRELRPECVVKWRPQ